MTAQPSEADSSALVRELERLFTAALGVRTRVLRRQSGLANVLVVEARCADAVEMARFAARWRALVALRLGVVATPEIVRLAVLRRAYEARNPALDGFAVTGRVVFARWLFQHGRLAG